MHQELRKLAETLHGIADDAELSLAFYNAPNSKSRMFYDLLQAEIMHHLLHSQKFVTIEQVESTYAECMKFLERSYQSHTYAAHETHFHTSFLSYVICPYTCVEEIADCIDKSLKGV